MTTQHDHPFHSPMDDFGNPKSAAVRQELPKDNLFCLLPGRHPIPGDPPALLAGWDFWRGHPVPHNLSALIWGVDDGPCWIEDLDQGLTWKLGQAPGNCPDNPVNLVVTGLTPALCWALWALVSIKRPYVMLWHHDRDSGGYWPSPAPTWAAFDAGKDFGQQAGPGPSAMVQAFNSLVGDD